MVNKFTRLGILIAVLASLASPVLAQNQYKGDRLYRAKNRMSGNLVRTVFYNYGLVGNVGEISGEWPAGTGNEYVGDVSPLVGVQFRHPSGDTLVAVCTSDGPRGNPDGPQGGGAFWGFEPLPGFVAEPEPGRDLQVAMSDDPATWPSFWPDRMYNDIRDQNWVRDINDPGWPGAWNGYFGKNQFNADQETYFQMDDQSDEEWFQRSDTLGNTYYFYPSREDSSRRGLGLRVTVRGLQWAHFLAQDCIFWLYEITNVSSYVYDKVTFGMMVGTLSGGRQDSRDDLAQFILDSDITYSYDFDDVGSPGWVPVRPGEKNVGYVGYAFLESPGNPYDGIDNDGDDTLGGASAPVLTESILNELTEPRSYFANDPLVVIDYEDYSRTVVNFPAEGPLLYSIRGEERQLQPGQVVTEDGANGLDDNFNGLIDERRNDSTFIGLKYIDYFTGAGVNDPMIDEARDDGIDNDNDWNFRKDDVGADGAAGTRDLGEGDGLPTNGEPNFDRTDVNESDQIGLTAFEYFTPPGAVRMRDDPALWLRMQPGRVDTVNPSPEDGDFLYGSGYFPLAPGQTERFSMALVYGADLPDIENNERIVQQVYDENYNFARPPDPPTVWAVPGDGKVTLYWDGARSENSIDPVSDTTDFEGYKIYRSTDPRFLEVFTVTDYLGNPVFFRPVAQFDLINEWENFFPLQVNGITYFLGSNSGVVRSWTDNAVENGQTYYYAVCAYDRGDLERGIFPAENDKTINVDEGGNVTLDVNTAIVTPRAPATGYETAQISGIAHTAGEATGAITPEILDPLKVPDNAQYSFTFLYKPDTLLSDTMPGDSIPADTLIQNLFGYRVSRDIGGARDTVVEFDQIIPRSNLLPFADRLSAYYDSLFNLEPGTYFPRQHFDVAESRIYDGQRAYMLVPRDTAEIGELSHWVDTSASLYGFDFNIFYESNSGLLGTKIAANYAVEWYGETVDTSRYFYYQGLELLPVAVNFRVKNLTSDSYIPFLFLDRPGGRPGRVDSTELIIFYEPPPDNPDTLEVSWFVRFNYQLFFGDTVAPRPGDELRIFVYQNFSTRDEYVYTSEAARINADKATLANIRVYPNPYVGVSPQEPSNRFAEGRGERRITFTHLPPRCTIRVYSVKGELVQTLDHNTTVDDGTQNWDLRSRDGLNVAYGVYLYHVDSEYGEASGRFAVVK